MLKASLALEAGLVPRTLHVSKVSPAVAACSGLRVVRRAQRFATGSAWAAVSSFGLGGANAHAVLRAPTVAERGVIPRYSRKRLPPLLITAPTEDGLHDQAARWAERARALNRSQLAASITETGHRRRRHRVRAWIDAPDGRTLADALDDLAAPVPDSEDEQSPQTAPAPRPLATDSEVVVHRGTSPFPQGTPDHGVAFVYSGNGGQYAGMARDLLDTNSVARQAFDEASAALVEAGADPEHEAPAA
ncbi:MAG: ketoacyl-synthetase C-terminal extension domain-containing protein, partial [Pseudomonadota bacterium]